jgi:hypothetical protein
MSAQENRAYESRSHVIRTANEGIAAKAAALHFVSRVPMLCECDEPDCRELVLLTLADYRQAREQHEFLTAPGHDTGRG